MHTSTAPSLLLVLTAVLVACAEQTPDCDYAAETDPAKHQVEWANEPVDLAAFERTVFSQGGEDGVIEKIFEIIKPTHRYAVEFGASNGIRASNVRNLILNHGWGALQIEGDPKRAAELLENYRDVPNVTALEAWVWPGNIEILFEENGVPPDFDLLVIDIDGNDYYVWRAIQQYRPKVVMIETNSVYPPPEQMVIEFHPMNYWDKTGYVGASLQTLTNLGKKKGYELIYHMNHGANAIFVDEQYFPALGIRDNSPETLYKEAPDWVKKLMLPAILPGREFLTQRTLQIKKKIRTDR